MVAVPELQWRLAVGYFSNKAPRRGLAGTLPLSVLTSAFTQAWLAPIQRSAGPALQPVSVARQQHARKLSEVALEHHNRPASEAPVQIFAGAL